MLLRICPDNAHREQGMAQVLCSPPVGFSELPLEGVCATGERGSAKSCDTNSSCIASFHLAFSKPSGAMEEVLSIAPLTSS